jgi:hypothetical protein
LKVWILRNCLFHVAIELSIWSLEDCQSRGLTTGVAQSSDYEVAETHQIKRHAVVIFSAALARHVAPPAAAKQQRLQRCSKHRSPPDVYSLDIIQS